MDVLEEKDVYTHLLAEVDSSNPCGVFIDDDDQLENDFILLESLASTNQAELFDEDSAVSADWKLMQKNCIQLLEKTKDVRLLIYLCQSSLKLKHFDGFYAAVSLLRRVLEIFWQEVHPKLNDTSSESPWRIMCINELSGDTINRLFLTTPMVNSALAGIFTMRDIKLAKGELSLVEGSDEAINDIALIHGCTSEMPQLEISDRLVTLDHTLAEIEVIEHVVSESEASHALLSFDQLKQDINYSIKYYSQFITDVAPATAVVEEASASTVGAPAASEALAVQPTIHSGVTNRSDVIRQIDEICKYYQECEPSSPVPMLLERAKKLVTMDFMSILKDVSPDGVQQAAMIMGSESE